MTDLTAYVENQLADWLSQGIDMNTAPSSLWVALHNNDPGIDPDGSTEVSAADYSREGTAPGTDWNVSGNEPRTIENANTVAFGTAQNDWGDITHATIWTASGTGNALGVYEATTVKAIDAGDTAEIESGSMTFEVQ